MKKLLTICLCLCLWSCGEEKTEKKVADITFQKVPFAELANWKNDDVNMAKNAFVASCNKIKFEKNEFLSNSNIKIPTKKYQEICAKLKNQNFKKFIEENFEPYLIIDNKGSESKFTSYYESAINGSYTKDDKYKFPIYGKPNDLIEFNLADFAPELGSKRFVGRIKNNKLIPYYNRAEIEKSGINAPIILWADSAIDIYVMQIQGSAVATLPDGKKIRIGYADNNGLTFRGIGSILLEKGLIKPGQASMGQIKKWLIENYEIAKEPLNENKRYIFHKIIEATGPIGAQGVPLTAGRSLAVDKSIIPLGAMLWLETTGPHKEKIEKLMIAQDVGSAIKGVVRGDYFWGSGEEALEFAGKMNSKGRYFILIPKKVLTNEQSR